MVFLLLSVYICGSSHPWQHVLYFSPLTAFKVLMSSIQRKWNIYYQLLLLNSLPNWICPNVENVLSLVLFYWSTYIKCSKYNLSPSIKCSKCKLWSYIKCSKYNLSKTQYIFNTGSHNNVSKCIYLELQILKYFSQVERL